MPARYPAACKIPLRVHPGTGTARCPLGSWARSVSPVCAPGMLSRAQGCALGCWTDLALQLWHQGDGNRILPGSPTPAGDDGYPLSTVPWQQWDISRDPAPQPGPSPAQCLLYCTKPISIQSPFPGECSHCLHALLGDLLSTLSCSIPAHPMLSQLPTHPGKRLGSFQFNLL